MTQPQPAPILVIEGIDGSGKGTQAQRLKRCLTDLGHRACLLSFPQYDDTFFGQRIADFLNGRFGSLDQLDPFLVSLLYAGDRFESRTKIVTAQDTVDLVILDRYVASNIAHQTAKYDTPQREQLRDWIEQIEYEIYRIPRETQVVLLDTPVDVSQALIAQKSPRSYTDQAADLQEADQPYLKRVREVYLELAQLNNHWTTVPVTCNGELRTIDEIGQEILDISLRLLTAS